MTGILYVIFSFLDTLDTFDEGTFMKMVSTVLVTIAVFLQIGGFILYGIHVFSSTTIPNTASWFLWSYLSSLNAFAYYQDSGKDLSKSGVAIINALAMVSTFIFSIYLGSMALPPAHDYLIITIGLLASYGWYRYSASVAQVMLQIAFTIAFIPTYLDLWDNPLLEQSLPWFLWEASFFLGVVIVCLHWKGRYMEIMYPFVAFLRVGILLVLLYWSPLLHSLFSL
ncbi:hypothetical protein D4R99_02155 [bacterium]|nr:MAG: hypothetical protein D4R99_02155 [bacterium]